MKVEIYSREAIKELMQGEFPKNSRHQLLQSEKNAQSRRSTGIFRERV